MNGPGESGKGTVAEFLNKLFEFDIVEYSSIDYVKEVARDSFGWNGEKDTKGRNLLAAVKQVMIAYNDMPTKKVIERLNDAIAFNVDILIVDIREPDEIEKLVEYCKEFEIICNTCRVHNAKAEKKAETDGLSLTGDRLYGEYDYDIDLNNNGTFKELEVQVATVFQALYNCEMKDQCDDALRILEEQR